MNFLAHAFLSFGEPEILVGNMISDFVKGKRQYDYITGVFKGIKLHRAIDEFTDNHTLSHKAKTYFRPVYRLYSAAFVDIVYDHFLANDHLQFIDEHALAAFSTGSYQILYRYEDMLPSNFRLMLPFMEKQDWLSGYRTHEGIRRSFSGMVRRSKYLNESAAAFSIFIDRYHDLESCYREFFPELKEFALNRLHLLNTE